MRQPKLYSMLESIANTIVGYAVAVASQVIVFPLFGIAVPLSTNLAIGLWFTAISFVRSYVLRRMFDKLKEKQ